MSFTIVGEEEGTSLEEKSGESVIRRGTHFEAALVEEVKESSGPDLSESSKEVCVFSLLLNMGWRGGRCIDMGNGKDEGIAGEADTS